MSMVNDGIRLSATLFVLILLASSAAFRIFKHRIFGGIARKISFFEVFCFAVFIFALCLPYYLYNVVPEKYSHLDNTKARIEMIVHDVYSDAEYYSAFSGNVRTANLENVDFNITVFAPFPAEIKENDIIVFDALLSRIDESNTDVSLSYFKRNNILFSAEALADGLFLYLGEYSSPVTRLSSANRRAGYMLDFRLDPKEAALSKALLLGDRSYLPAILDRDFSRIGISHILALSGMHLALIIGLYTFFAKRLIPCRLLLRISVLPLTVFILLFTGLSASLLRTSLMLIVSYIGFILKKKPDPMTVLFFVAFIILAFDPRAVFDVGLILSLSSVFGILLLMPYFNGLRISFLRRTDSGFVLGRVMPFVYNAFTISFSACTFTLPAMFFFFDYASLIGILSTFIFSPLIVIYIVITFLVFVFYNSPQICSFISHVASEVYGIIERISEELSSLDRITVSCFDPTFAVAFLAIIIALIIAMARNSLRAHFAAFVLAAHIVFVVFVGTADVFHQNIGITPLSGDDGYTFVISNQDENAVLDLSNGKTSDAARASRGAFAALDTHIDTVIISQYGMKHHFMLSQLNSNLPVKRIVLPIPETETEVHYANSIMALAKEFEIGVGFFEPGKQFVISDAKLTILSSRKYPTDSPALAINITLGHRDYLIVDGNPENGAEDTAFSSLAHHADVVYLCSQSSPDTPPRSAFGRDTLVFSP